MRHAVKQQKGMAPKIVLAVLLVAVLSISSVVTVMANTTDTVDVTVYDGSETYRFGMIGQNPQDILARAQTEGMKPVSDIDTYTFSAEDGTLTVQRNVRVSVKEDGAAQLFVVPQGETLKSVLTDNGITLSAWDTVSVDPETVLNTDTAVKITRSARVFVSADGKRRMTEHAGGTVADALAASDVTLGKNDTVEPAADTALTNGMHIRVQRGMELTVTADGTTRTQSAAAENCGDAVEAMGFALGEDDRILAKTADGEKQVKADEAVSDGENLRVVRVSTEEVEETEEIPFETKYEDTDTLYEGETEVKTAGEKGEKRTTYTVTYADGKEESRTVKETKTVKEAKNEVVLRGTKAKGNVFTDDSGTETAFAYSLTGSCTAYYADEGAVTSVGAVPQVGYVAVDPDVIPYGSLLYITAVDGSWTYGYCYAMDTGGAAMCGDIVADLYYDTQDECIAFGRRDMIVYVIRSGW